MAGSLLILSSEASADSDQALRHFAEFLGVKTDSGSASEAASRLSPSHQCVAMSFETVKSLVSQASYAEFQRRAGCLFIYDFDAAGEGHPALGRLTGNAVKSVAAIQSGKKEFSIHESATSAGFPIAGKSYSVESAAPINVFSGLATDNWAESLIAVNGQPHFLSVSSGGAKIFLLAVRSLFDIEKPVSLNFNLRDYYAEWCALGILLRSIFGADCWTAPDRFATVTIDDPSLQKRYGFVEYETLLPEIKKLGCALTIGFIPYNHRRSNPRVVDLARRHQGQFSITVHGCDHMGGEFASCDERWLNAISNCALQRMDSHFRTTQMPYDDVMIFPQGRFSTKAMTALKQCRYVAAVNSSPWAADVTNGTLTARALLDVAVTSYSNFPLFVRRYPRDAFDFAFDTFFQKPLIVVEHHEYFRDGYAPLRRFVGQLDAIGKSRPTWLPLREAVTSSCVMRPNGEGRYQARFFTPVFKLRNPAAQRRSFSLMKPETSNSVTGVFWGQRSIPFEIQSGYLHCEVEAAPGEEQELKVVYKEVQKSPHHPSIKYRAKVLVRRLLSDARDNYLSRSSFLLAAARKAKKMASRS